VRTIIAGSRTVTDPRVLQRALTACGWVPTLVLSGCARGADYLGEMWALEHGVPLDRYPADWNAHGRRAGFIRNEQMAAQADALIALWDGESKGTAHMIETARARGLLVYIQAPHTPRLYNRLSGPCVLLQPAGMPRQRTTGDSE